MDRPFTPFTSSGSQLISSCFEQLRHISLCLDNLSESILALATSTEGNAKGDVTVRKSQTQRNRPTTRINAQSQVKTFSDGPHCIHRHLDFPTTQHDDRLGPSRQTNQMPTLYDDILVLIFDLLREDQLIGNLSIRKNTTDFKSLRLVCDLFSKLVSKTLFQSVAIGRHLSSCTIEETPPDTVTWHARYLVLHAYAFSNPDFKWTPLVHGTLLGIHCEGSRSFPYWDRLATLLVSKVPKLDHFGVELNILTFKLSDLPNFSKSIHTLSLTITSITVDLRGCHTGYDVALLDIRLHLVNLKYMHFLHMDPDSAMNALTPQGWACSSSLRTLRLSHCYLPYTRLSDFIYYAKSIQNLILESCTPWDASENVGWLYLPINRSFQHLEIPTSYGLSGAVVIVREDR